MKVKIHKIELYIIDFDKLGAEGVTSALENQSYSNDCINPNVVAVDTREVDWSDDHPLNNNHAWAGAYLDLFGGEAS